MSDREQRAREAARLARLDDYAIMGTGRDDRFDRIAKLAARQLDTPIALVSFVGADTQWFKSAVGLAVDGTPRDVSFCTHVVANGGVTVVPDATKDERFASNPLVTGPPGIRFYAGAPLTVESGHTLGTLCVIDTKPRVLDPSGAALLADLAQLVVDELELHRLLIASRHSEATARQSENLLQSILNQLYTFVGVLDVDGMLVEANEASLEASGLALDDVSGRLFWDCYWWSYSDHVKQQVRAAVEQAAHGHRSRFDVGLRVKNGRLVPTDLLIAPLQDQSGRVTHIVASGVDISERVTLADDRRRLARIVEEAPFLIRTATPDGRLLYVNRAGREMLGYAPNAEITSAEVAHHHPDWAMQRLRTEGYPVAREEGTWSGEAAIFNGEGREVPTAHVIIAHRSPAGEVEYFSSIAVDISASKAAEESLRDSEARFRGTFENAAVGIAHIGLLGRWHRVNERLLEIVGYARAELVQKTFQEITHPDDRAGEMARFDALKSGQIDSYSLEKRLLRKDGSIVWVQATMSMQETRGGSEPYAIGVLEDISQRKAAEHRQRLLLAELNHRVKNTLAIVQSIANQSLRQAPSPQAFATSFLGRLHALSGAHDLLTEQCWDGVDLSELLRSQITLNGAIPSERLKLDGPALLLPPQLALNLAIVLHELATNAVSFGAFSNEVGRIDVQWSTRPVGTAIWLELVWQEHGGPQPVTPMPPRAGATVLERSLRQGLGGTCELDWKEAGLEVRLSLPLPSAPGPSTWFET